MKIRRVKRSLFNDSSASSDIAFLLIIYFIVIAGFNVNMGFLMNLPAKNSTRELPKEELMRFEMSADGSVFRDSSLISLADAGRQIRAALAYMPNLAVVLEIDPKTPWQNVVSFVELAQNTEVNSFSFRMRQE